MIGDPSAHVNDTSAGRRLREGARLAVLVNPAARAAGDRVSVEGSVRRLASRYHVDVVVPRAPADLSDAARTAGATHDAIIVAGGDGTLHYVVNALSGRDVPIGMLPLGTGNDFTRSLGMSNASDGPVRAVLDGHVRAVDLVEVNGRVFCTVGVLGLAAEATMAYNRLLEPRSWARPVLKRTGGFAYRLAGLLAVIRAGATAGHAAVTVDDRPAPGPLARVQALFVTNGTMLGGGMTLPVESRIDDGLLEVVSVTALSRPRLFWAFACLANGWRIPDGAIAVVRGAHAVIAMGLASTFAADGEVMEVGTRFDVRVKPGALQVIAPPA